MSSVPDAVPLATDDHTFLFLMVQRKDTMGFIDFVRGKYPSLEPERSEMLKIYLSEMTCEERLRLRHDGFDQIWNAMWKNHASKSYISEYVECRRKYDTLDVPALLDSTLCCWTEQEYGFPKGRKNIRETDESCAIREFCEESGYRRHEIRMLSQEPFEEVFRGTNGIRYRHVYYLAEVLKHVQKPRMDPSNIQQVGEIRNVGWFTLDQCLQIIRPYDKAKKQILTKVHEKIKKTCCPETTEKT
jgi:8-oxo-dGTP pyrophosphatase MutT (NUDIX family)